MKVHLALVTALAACAPRLDPGPIPAERAAAPVRLLERPEAAAQNVYLQATIAAGSAYDPVGSEGLAYLTARALTEAGAGERTAEQVREALAPTGNGFDLVVDREWVTLRLRCHVDHQALCAELFTSALVAPRFEDADVGRLRDEAAYAVSRGVLEDEELLGMRAFEATLYEGHPYGHPPEGRSGVLPTLDPSDLAAFHARHYVREALLVGLAGGYSDATRDAVRAALASAPAVPKPELVLMRPPAVEGRSLAIVETGSTSAGFHLGHPVELTRDHPDWVALHLAATALGAHRQSFGRLYRTLRGHRGLNYGDYAYVEPYVERGWTSDPEQGTLRRHPAFYVWLRPTTAENGPFALKLAVDEVERWVAEGLTEQEFEDTRSYLLNRVALLAPDPGRRLAYALEAEAAGLPNPLELLPSALPALTRDGVAEAVARHIRPEDLRIVAVGGDAASLRARIVEGSPTPIVYRDVTPDAATAARDAAIAADDLGIAPEDAWIVPAEGIFR